ncbi:MAG: phosphatidate cytidylyltransferase [Magnetococcus sp. MYC-9]
MNSPLLIRTLSALLLAPPLLLLLLAGSPFWLFLLTIPVAIVLMYEWHRLQEPFTLRRFLPLLLGVLLLLFSTSLPGTGAGQPPALPFPFFSMPLSISCGLLLLLLFAEELWRYRPGGAVVDGMGRRFFGVLYCVLPLLLLVEVRYAERGGLLICHLLLMIWATDVGAFFAGRRWGERKLAPHISPGKTVAGFWGGVVLASVVGGGMAHGFSLPYDGLEATLLGAALSVVGQMGDLAESMLKREAGVKDSGQLIPGHGGALDRLDSLLFAAPVYYIFLWGYALIPSRGW